MKDLTSYIKFVEDNASILSTPGLGILELYCSFFPTPIVLISPIPLSLIKTLTFHPFSNRKSVDFWGFVVAAMALGIAEEIKGMLVACLGLHFFRALVELFLWIIDVITTADLECSAIETSRDPPKIFIPIPKIESNGCARSDLSARLFLASEFQCRL